MPKHPEEPGSQNTRDAPSRLGPYELGPLLGRGGMGTVFRAFDRRLRRWVAVKRVRRDASERSRKRFRREAHTLARLAHPSIIQIFDIVETSDGDWIVMELVDGTTLAEVRDRGPVDVPLTVEVALQITSALQAAHALGLVHRDLKAENVMLLPTGQVKVLDFGLAHQSLVPASSHGVDPSDSVSRTATQLGHIVGTPRSMSPEQVLGQKVDGRSDLFSLGVLLYELLTQISPFASGSVEATLGRVLTHSPSPVLEVAPRVLEPLSRLIDHLMEKRPEHRPQDAAMVIGALEALPSSRSIGSVSTQHLSRTTPFRTTTSPASPPPDLGQDSTQVQETVAPEGPTIESQNELPNYGERRHITLLSCELLQLSADLVPRTPEAEHLAEALPRLVEQLESLLQRYGGSPGRSMGHRPVAYFGYPEAHEDDAVRAIHTALELIALYPNNPKNDELSLRVGLHTGPVVIQSGTTAADSDLVLGETLDITLQMQGAARLADVVVSPTTRQRSEPYFSWQPLPDGFRVLDSLQPHLQGAPAQEEMSLVSRQEELGLIARRWQMTREGHGQIVLITGEAGIGKTRLLKAVRHHVAPRLPDRASPRWWTVYGSPFLEASPFAPLIDLLRRHVLVLQPEDTHQILQERLEMFLLQLDLPVGKTLPWLLSLLELPADPRHVEPKLAPIAQRRKILQSLIQVFLAMARQQPWVLVVEDLHWMDPSTLEWVEALGQHIETAPLFLLATSRPHGLPSWDERVPWTRIHLENLTHSQGSQLLDQISRGYGLDPNIRQQILDRSDGIPLFIEEMTRSFLESERTSEDLAIPNTLRDSLTARLDRLGLAKRVVQAAAVLGRDFSMRHLEAVADLDEGLLRRGLEQLLQSGLVLPKSFGDGDQFAFKHALIQDLAYDSLLRRDRCQLHLRAADALSVQRPDIAETRPEILAHHYSRAGDSLRALTLWRQAGQRALVSSAHFEAQRHFLRALALLSDLEGGPHRDREELMAQVGLATSETISKGYSHPDIEGRWIRADALSQRVGGESSWEALWGLYSLFGMQGDKHRAQDCCQQILRLAQKSDDPALRILSHSVSATNHFFQGDFLQTLEHCRQWRQWDGPEVGSRLILSTGSDARVVLLCFEAMTAWITGQSARAADCADQGMRLARQLEDPFTLGVGLQITTHLSLFRQDISGAAERARKVIELSQEHGFFLLHQSHVGLACANGLAASLPSSAEQEDPTPNLDPITETLFRIDNAADQGVRAYSSLAFACLVRMCLDQNRLSEAQQHLTRAKTFVDESGERFWLASILRLEGDLMRRLAHPEAAEAAYLQALEVAKQQGAEGLAYKARGCLSELEQSPS